MNWKEKIELIRQAQVYREEIEDLLSDVFQVYVDHLTVEDSDLHVERSSKYYDDHAEYSIPIDEFIEKAGKKEN